MVNPHEEKCTHGEFYGTIPNYEKYLKTLGNMGVICSIYTIKEKLEDWRNICMFLCYAPGHTGGI